MYFLQIVPETLFESESQKDLPGVLVIFLLFPPAPLDNRSKITTLAVLHDDEDLGGVLVNDAVIVADDVLVTKLTEDINLRDQLDLLLLAHATVVDLLPGQNLQMKKERLVRETVDRETRGKVERRTFPSAFLWILHTAPKEPEPIFWMTSYPSVSPIFFCCCCRCLLQRFAGGKLLMKMK